ncbi:MAG: transposase [Solirubrobacteraceae bacterium]|jgi:transposase|nr:transposase [Solirubrobacteraceae bacterium]
MGVSGRAMMHALIDGNADADALAELAKGKLRRKLPALRKALQGRLRAHHAFLLERMLAHIEDLEVDIKAISARVEQQIGPFEAAVALLRTIRSSAAHRRGAHRRTGADMSAFPTAGHLASWAGVCPGRRESQANASPPERARVRPGCAPP